MAILGLSRTLLARAGPSRRRGAAHCSLSVSPWTRLDHSLVAAADDDDDDGFECLGSVTAEERAAAARRAAEAAGNVLEVESPPRRRSFASDADATFLPVPRSPRTPVEGALPPVPTFMGRGTARRPVEPPAPAPGFGARANYDPVLDE